MGCLEQKLPLKRSLYVQTLGSLSRNALRNRVVEVRGMPASDLMPCNISRTSVTF